MSRILIVDDSAVDRQLVGGLLGKNPDWTLDFAENGKEALDAIAAYAPEVVVTDLMMPEMDGLELVAEISAGHPTIPVILMTGRGSEQIAFEALKAGAASYVPKSQLDEGLVDTVNGLLNVADKTRMQFQLMNSLVQSVSYFVLDTDAAVIPPLIAYLHRGVRAVHLCDDADGIRICVALEEALNNALFHGNLELCSSLREDPESYRKLVEERRQSHPFRERKIHVRTEISREMAKFTISDEGPGFDPDTLPDPTDVENLEKISGRGLLLMRTFMDDVNFNDAGNQVTMIKQGSAVPAAG